MKKKYRLLKKKDFQQVLNKRLKIFTDSLVCYYLPDKRINNIKVGLIIPKKKIKKANDRNYLKRLFWYVNQQEELKSLPKIKCIFFYNKFFYQSYDEKNLSIKKLSFELKKIYSELISKSNVLKN